MNLISLYKLRMKMLIRSAILVIPTIVIAGFIAVMYSITPSQITASFLLSGFVLFVICTVMSMCIASKEDDVHEEMLQLHSRSETGFYISRELVYLTICVVYSLVLIIYPVFSAMRNDSFFTRQLQKEDVIMGGLLIFANALCGMAIGDFFHKRIVHNRKAAVILLIVVAALAVVKFSVIHDNSILKYPYYLIPPVMDGFKMVGSTDLFDSAGTVHILIHAIVFVLVTMIVKIRLLIYKKY